MLLAKIRDVLLNRRNKVEIESIEGKLPSVEVDGNIKAKDIQVDGITSKGIANTGGLANIGDVAISGNLDVQGEGKGKITANEIDAGEYKNLVKDSYLFEASSPFNTVFCLSKQINDLIFLQFKVSPTSNVPSYTDIAEYGYQPSSPVIFPCCVGTATACLILGTNGKIQCTSAVTSGQNLSANVVLQEVNLI